MAWTAATQTALFPPADRAGRPAITVHYPNGTTDTPADLGAALVAASRHLSATGRAHLSDSTGWGLTITATAEHTHQPQHGHPRPNWIGVAIKRLRENQ